MKKRLLSLLLTGALCLSLSAPALAAGLENFQKTNTYTAGQFTDVPAGEWYDFYTGERFTGGQAVDVGCADTIPVFSLGGRWRANEV